MNALVQARYWMLTIPFDDYQPLLVDSVSYIKGQAEKGLLTGYKHWQICVCFKVKRRCGFVKSIFGLTCHAEATRSEAAFDYVWKEETRIAGTQFEFGELPFNRSKPICWKSVWDNAKVGNVEAIPFDIRVRSYNSIKRIEKDYAVPVAMERIVYVFVGSTGIGKSHRAWMEAGLDAYPKSPSTKFWDGYTGQQNVIIDEFAGEIGISHVLRWFDKYPVLIETKGGGCVLKATKFWVTTNVHPVDWFPLLDRKRLAALLRRLVITVFDDVPYVPPAFQ